MKTKNKIIIQSTTNQPKQNLKIYFKIKIREMLQNKLKIKLKQGEIKPFSGE